MSSCRTNFITKFDDNQTRVVILSVGATQIRREIHDKDWSFIKERNKIAKNS